MTDVELTMISGEVNARARLEFSTRAPIPRSALTTSPPTSDRSAEQMSAGSISLPTERSGVHSLALERLGGVGSSKSNSYVAWRDKSERLDHAIETLERISSALCAPPDGPAAVCDAVVEAAAHTFDARWAAMVFSAEYPGVGTARVLVNAGQCVIQRVTALPRVLAVLVDRTLAAHAPVLAEHDEGLEFGGDPCVIAAAPMPVPGEPAGILAIGLPYGVEVQRTDMSILLTLANQAGVALRNASLFREDERRAAELERRGSELEGILRRLERAGRRQLVSEERDRIARELHDSVAQHLLTIGMNLEWCRRHESTSPPILEQVLAAQALARFAMDEIRDVIFGLAGDRELDLPGTLRDVIEDIEAGTRLKVGLRVYGRTQPLPAATRHALVQIAREALFNVAHHADAHHAWMTVRWQPQVVSLAVADDGSGDHHELQHQLCISEPHGNHVGLSGIAERVHRLGGAGWFERRRGGGVRLRVEVPSGRSTACREMSPVSTDAAPT